MKTLNEQIQEVMQSRTSKTAKTKDLIKLGIKTQDIATLFKFYQLEDEGSLPYTIGVEIECFNVNRVLFISKAQERAIRISCENYNHDTKNHYKVVSDCSILGENSLECVSPVLKGKTGLKSLSKVCDSLNESGAQVNRSTGLHIHIGLQNITDTQYKNLFINYYYLENAIDSFMAKSRRGNENNYCKSLKQIIFNKIWYCATKEDIDNVFLSDRYYKLNPISYRRHNTIEFRQHQGTTEYAKIEMWVKFICKLVRWSKNNRLESNLLDISDIPFLSEKEKEFFINRAAALA